MRFKASMAISPTPAEFAPLLFAGRWREALDAASELGYEAVELSVRDPADEAVKRCVAEARRRGVEVAAIATGQSYYSDGWSLTAADTAIQKLLEGRMGRIIDLAASWGALVVIGGVRGTLDPGDASGYSRAVAALRRWAEYAASQNVSMAIEPINRYETNFINTVGEALDFIDRVGLDNVGVLPDTFHMNIEEVSMTEALAAAGPALLHVQFVDNNRRAPGQGHIEFTELAAVLDRLDYRGYLSAEILPLPDDRTAAAQAMSFFHTL